MKRDGYIITFFKEMRKGPITCKIKMVAAKQ